MTYLIIFNERRGYTKEEIRAESWLKFIEELNRLVQYYSEPPDLIYLKDGR